jgi:hypothetical protein
LEFAWGFWNDRQTSPEFQEMTDKCRYLTKNWNSPGIHDSNSRWISDQNFELSSDVEILLGIFKIWNLSDICEFQGSSSQISGWLIVLLTS